MSRYTHSLEVFALAVAVACSGVLRGVPAEGVKEDAGFIGGWTQGEISPSKGLCAWEKKKETPPFGQTIVFSFSSPSVLYTVEVVEENECALR